MHKFSKDEIKSTIHDLITFKNAAALAAIDSNDSNINRPSLYILDYNITYPYLWEDFHSYVGYDPNRSEFYNRLGQYIVSKSMNYRSASKIELGITDASIIEAIEQVSHKYDHFEDQISSKNSIDDLFDRLKKILEVAKRNLEVDQVESSRLLSKISKALPNGSISRSIGRFLSLIETRQLNVVEKMFGEDTVTEILSEHQSDYEKILENLERSRSGNESRDHNHSRFHYSIDAQNLTLIKFLNKHYSESMPYFICKNSLQDQCGDKQVDRFTRSAVAPFLRLYGCVSAPENTDMRYHMERVLRDVFYSASRLSGELDISLKAGVTIDKDIESVIQFFAEYGWNAFEGGINLNFIEDSSMEIERVEKLLRSKKSLLEYYDQAKSDAVSGGAKIAEHRMPDLGKAGLRSTRDIASNS